MNEFRLKSSSYTEELEFVWVGLSLPELLFLSSVFCSSFAGLSLIFQKKFAGLFCKKNQNKVRGQLSIEKDSKFSINTLECLHDHGNESECGRIVTIGRLSKTNDIEKKRFFSISLSKTLCTPYRQPTLCTN